jgi:N-acetylglucosaminyldiphosphoundecaprenol N-acetyl-beta-D-mannosaminyltransferase
MTGTTPARVRLLNASFDPLTSDELVDNVMRDVRDAHRGWVATVNVAVLMQMRQDEVLQRFVDRARWVVADGQPLVWQSRVGARSQTLPERVVGVELVHPICRRAAADGVGVYLLGSSSQVVSTLAAELLGRYPGLTLHWSDGYFGAEEAADRARRIAESGARILFVGMGVPRQERFIEQQWDHMGVTTAIGVGGSFDVLAGARHRAPRWMQRSGLEWSFRLVQEPRRLGRRYLTTNAQYLRVLVRERRRP